MAYTLTYSNIHESEKKMVGTRAIYIAKAAKKNISHNLFFVITNNSFEDFIKNNNLREKIDELFQSKLSEDEFWISLRKFISNGVFSDKVEREILESYEAMSITTSDASNILRSYESRINIFVSSDIVNNLDGIFLNIKGASNLLNAVKSAWFYFLKAQGLNNLKNRLNSSVGLIIEKFISADLSVEVEVSQDNKHLLIQSYKGLPDIVYDVVKDNHILSFNHLEFITYELNNQNHSIIHQDESGVLLKKRLGREGSNNKATKQIISECARLAKKVFSEFDAFVKIIFVVKKDIPYIFLINPNEPINDANDSLINTVHEEIINRDINMGDINLNPGVSVKEKEIITSQTQEYVDYEESNNDNIVNTNDEELNEVSDELIDGFDDSDEFIVQDSDNIDTFEDDVYSSFFKLMELLEKDLERAYLESFGFSPSSLEEAVFELDSKHSIRNRDDILHVLKAKSSLMQGESVDKETISSLSIIIEDFLRRDIK